MNVPLVSFDDVMAYADMVENGLSPESEVENTRKELLLALQEFGKKHILFQQERQRAGAEVAERVIALHEQEDHLLAAKEQLADRVKALQDINAGIEQLKSANCMAQNYLGQLQTTNTRLITQLNEMQKASKSRHPLGRNQEQIYGAVNGLNEHLTK